MKKIRIMIVDDHELIREGLRKILDIEKGFEIVAIAKDGLEAVEMTKISEPDVILMDINMPRKNGIETTVEIKKKYPQIKIIALTIHEDEEYIFELIKAGVSGYVLKDIAMDKLAESIRKVYEGESVIASSVTSKLISGISRMQHREKQEKQKPSLTRREKEVLKLLTEGKANRVIAEELFLSEKTVKNHVSNILHKLSVEHRTQAVLHALKHDLV